MQQIICHILQFEHNFMKWHWRKFTYWLIYLNVDQSHFRDRATKNKLSLGHLHMAIKKLPLKEAPVVATNFNKTYFGAQAEAITFFFKVKIS